jgi:tetratricopeptide (TPR) repeat protein
MAVTAGRFRFPLFALAAFLVFSCAEGGEESLALYARASALYTAGDFAGASDLLKAEKFAPALVLRGKALYFCGKDTDAEASFRRALRLNPASSEASLFLARLLRDRGDGDGARRAAEALIRDNPQDVRALRLVSDLASARGDYENAAAFLDRAVEASAETALVFIDRARLRWSVGNGPGALEDLSRAEILLPADNSLSRSLDALRFRIAAEMHKGVNHEE